MSDLEKRVETLEKLMRQIQVQLVTLLNKAYGQRPVVLTGGYGRRGIEFEGGVPVSGNGAEVKKALEDLRAELSEKDIAAIDEALKERGIDVNLVLDPEVPDGVVVVHRDIIKDLEIIGKLTNPEIRGDENE